MVLRTFALDFLVAIGLDGNRYRLLIGLGFLVIVFCLAGWRPRALGALARTRRCPAAEPGGGRGHG